MKKNKNAKEETVPRLDLAPRLKRPLSLLNPLDYLRLLYWVFFFPQAIRWYLQEFGKPESRDKEGAKVIWKALRNDPVQRKLAYQAIITLIAAAFGTAWGLPAFGIPLDLGAVVGGVLLGLFLGMAPIEAFGNRVGLASIVMGGVTFGVMLCVGVVAAYYVANVVSGGQMSGVVSGVVFSVVFFAALFEAFVVAFVVAGSEKYGVNFVVKFGMMGGEDFFLAIIITVSRIFDYLFLLLPAHLICKPGEEKRWNC